MEPYVDVRNQVMIQRDTSGLTIPANPSISPFGCCNFFDNCSEEELMSLFFNGRLDLLDWMGFERTEECFRKTEYLSFVAPSDTSSTGAMPTSCLPPEGIDFGSCSQELEDFGRYGRLSKTREAAKPERFCKTTPVRFIDGSLVTSEPMWDEFMTMNQLLTDIRVALVNGNKSNAGEFDGLENIVTTGYECEGLDSFVIDWNNLPMDDGSGAVYNGNPMPGFDLVAWLHDIHRRIRERMSWSPVLQNQQSKVGDIIIVAPSFINTVLLDMFSAWSIVGPGVAFQEANISHSLPLREKRDSLNGGLFGHGRIFLDQMEIPLLNYNWAMTNGPTRGDLYMLTGSMGSMRVWEGEYLDARNVPKVFEDMGISGNPGNFFTRDDGRVLGKARIDETCYNMSLQMMLRLFCKAPWAQARFSNIVSRTPTGPLSANPVDTSFFPSDINASVSC
ncbi:MAG: hypothetical protein V3W20_08475 [Candidatus Neomarinimicrobiota bacterium]